MKGMLLAGGTGSRMGLSTKVINKHLLCVYDKPWKKNDDREGGKMNFDNLTRTCSALPCRMMYGDCLISRQSSKA